MAPSGTTCMLLVDDRVVLRANAPPRAEYLLFEPSDIDLRGADGGPVREVGYRTTVSAARARLSRLGLTEDVRLACERAMQPVLSEAYARGPAVRRVATHLGPLELFQSETFDAQRQSYAGVFLDLPLLAGDLRLPDAGTALQALYLAAVLADKASDAEVVLSTDGWTRHQRPGTRTFQSPEVQALASLPARMGELAETRPAPQVRDHLPRADVIAFIRAHGDDAIDDESRAYYASLERAVSAREMPSRGPLSRADMWAIEMAIDAGAFDGVGAAIDEVEQHSGRTPGTTYLRARLALALRLEPPAVVAERISALSLSLTSFQELALLAAEAWLEAGDARRALPFARDLVDAPQIDEGLLLRAQRLLARTVGAAPERRRSSAALSLPTPLSAPPTSAPLAPRTRPPPAETPTRTISTGGVRGHALQRPATNPGLGVPNAQLPDAQGKRPLSAPPPAEEEARPETALPFAVERPPSQPPTRASRPAIRPIDANRISVSTLPREEPPSAGPARSEPPARRITEDAIKAPSIRPPPKLSSVTREIRESRIPGALDPRAEPESSSSMRAAKPLMEDHVGPIPERAHSMPPPSRAPRTSLRPSRLAPDENGPSPRASAPPGARSGELHGSAMPPYRLEAGPAPYARAPVMPALGNGSATERVEHLSLPPYVVPNAIRRGQRPASVLEARLVFTMLARELGAAYRVERGIDLFADERGIEAIQAVLLENGSVRDAYTPERIADIHRHGALLSELLARKLGAEWIDISSDEMGYWSMFLPPDMRVWPFGRVARFVQMGHRERDLVSYYLELSSRASPRAP